MPTNTEIILQAIEDLLNKRDPVRKAERAKVRMENKAQPAAVPVRADVDIKKPEGPPDRSESKTRPGIPKGIAHSVWLRDQRQCTHRYEDGARCEETTMLELDHMIPWSRGGEHSVDNLRVVCRLHNQCYAAEVYGEDFMEKFRNH